MRVEEGGWSFPLSMSNGSVSSLRVRNEAVSCLHIRLRGSPPVQHLSNISTRDRAELAGRWELMVAGLIWFGDIFIIFQEHVDRCVASPLSFNDTLWTAEDQMLEFKVKCCPVSRLIQDFSCSAGLLCRVFLFMARQMFSMGDKSGFQTGQFSGHAVVICAECGFGTVWLKKKQTSNNNKKHAFPEKKKKRRENWMAAYVVYFCIYTDMYALFSVNGAFPDV